MELNYVDIAIDAFGIALCLIALFACIMNRKVDKKMSYYYFWIFIICIFYAMSNMFGIIFKGKTYTYAVISTHITNFMEFLLTLVLSYIMSKFCLYFFKINIRHQKLIVFLIYLPSFIMVILSAFTGWYYYIDSDNIYHRGKLYYLAFVFGIIYLMLNFILFIKSFKSLNKLSRIAFIIYFIVPVIGCILQLTMPYGIYWLLIATLLSVVLMFLVMIAEQVNRYCVVEQEAESAKFYTVMSQIQPHFLYNSLTSIIALCDNNSKAKDALTNFAKYLRGNLDSIKTDGPIPFTKEIDHVNVYLSLELLRFEDKIKVHYDLKNQDFNLPALSVQIPVENAIKHGITQREDGGNLYIRTDVNDKYNIIVVEDDGVGFDETTIDKNRVHIGVKNLEYRIKNQVKGKINIESKLGVGTKVTIYIPKEK